jgi:signal peptidase I
MPEPPERDTPEPVPTVEAPEEVGEEAREGGPDLLRDYFETVLIAVVIVLFLQTFVFQQSKIPSGSMEDTLLVGDHILVNKFLLAPGSWERHLMPQREPRHGDVVIFRPPEDPTRDYIKRVIGVPGDVVALRDGRLFRNGAPVEEIHTKLSHGFAAGRNLDPLEIPPGHYFLMGDNRDESHDSRDWGPIPRESINGRAVMVWFSVEDRPLKAGGQDLTAARRVLLAFQRLLDFPSMVRWDRTMRPIR